MSGLTEEEKARFERDGYVGPFRFVDEDEMAKIRTVFEREVFDVDTRHTDRHRDSKEVLGICSDRRLTSKVESLLGPELLLWNTAFFSKLPGGKQIPWHQDHDFLFLDPCVNVNVWLAIDPATLENGCLRVIPQSHHEAVPHLPPTRKFEFIARADLRFVDTARAVPLVLSPGEFVILHKNVLHGSPTNLSMHRRMGLVARYTVPGVNVYEDGTKSPAPVYRV